MSGRYVCVDFGSTFTKAIVVDAGSGDLVARAEHPTTHADVMAGWHSCREQLLTADRSVAGAEVLACSSAGGGLRIAVVGNEELVTAEAGRRVALSSGGRVVTVAGGGLDQAALRRLRADQPDVVLLVGGTDGGNATVYASAARTLARGRWPGPVVAAGNIDAQDEVTGVLTAARVPHVRSPNVVPQIGVFAPDGARAAIREMFLAHVIGGKQLSADPAFVGLVRAATPDVVLRGAQVLAGLHGDLAVVDVGGATTDVHSVIELDPQDADLGREVVATHPVTRTVEGDLGMRWNAVSVVDAGVEAGLVGADDEQLRAAATRRRDEPGFLPADRTECEHDERLAAIAVTVALRRHAGRQRVVFGPDGRVLERSGKDLREVELLVGSGGVLRHNPPQVAARILRGVAVGAQPEGWLVPTAARTCVDADYVLAGVGLLADLAADVSTGLAARIARDPTPA